MTQSIPQLPKLSDLPKLPAGRMFGRFGYVVWFTAEQMHEYAFAALAAQPLVGVIPDWQPIETAPMDGTRILGFMRGRVCESFVTPRGDCEMWTFGMWTSSDGRAKPTHWMPLPPAPAHGIGTPPQGVDHG